MAFSFLREPIDHGDSNIWASYLMAQIRRGALGALTLELYNNGGALTLSAGYAGIDNGVAKGTIENSAASIIDISSITNSHWAQIELSVSGTVVTLAITEMADTDRWTIPATVKNAYDYTKQGYYITATKRLVGIVYKTAGAAVGRIVVCENNRFGFRGVEYVDTEIGGVISKSYVAKYYIELGAWNMDTTATLQPIGDLTNARKLIDISTLICEDTIALITPLNRSGFSEWWQPNLITLQRTGGGLFDSASYDNVAINRGTLVLTYLT